MSKEIKREGLEWIKTITIAIGIALIVRTFFFSSYIVDGESMQPTLEDGNLLLINKIGYDISDFKRFDVIVFHANEAEDYVKRIIGLPGDQIEYTNDMLYINGEKIDEPYLEQFKDTVNGHLTEDFSLQGITGVDEVPPGKLFVIGDNRKGSYDSRYFGFIDTEQVVGKVNFRFWPIDEIGVHF